MQVLAEVVQLLAAYTGGITSSMLQTTLFQRRQLRQGTDRGTPQSEGATDFAVTTVCPPEHASAGEQRAAGAGAMPT